MRSLFREPFVHFLLAGLLLFAGYAWLSSDATPVRSGSIGAGEDRIDVGQDALLAFVQNRTKNPDAEAVAREFAALDAQGRSAWVERFVREEALVREARRLGLDRDDELVRRRLVQQMEFLAEKNVAGTAEITPSDLESHYALHGESHRIPATLTFTHVYVKDAEDFDSPGERAQMLVNTMNADQVSARAAMPMGDRFLYGRNYVDRTLDEVESHFGSGFAQRLMEEPLSQAGGAPVWTGPYQSEHGWHLVLLRAREASRRPPLNAIADRLREEIRRARREAGLAEAVGEIVSRYRVSVDSALDAALGEGVAPETGGKIR
ncbi:MAG: hypothetical protein AB8G23_18805 [Myxococcota bacterium]